MNPAWIRHLPMTWLYRIILFLAWCYFKIFHRHKIYGTDNYYEGAAIIAANHTSYLDPPALAISWPQEVHFLARESLFKNRFFGGLIRKLNAHPVSGDAGDIGVFKLIGSLLSEGKKIILFPEGRRSETDELSVLKSGISLLVSRAEAAVIPAYIHGTYAVWNRKRKFPKWFGKTACVFGQPILWSSYAHLGKKEGQKALTDEIGRSIEALRKQYEREVVRPR
ncbi:MAG: 1-acyl-sn-glycerol-3-phosphate acyltransferase [Verrucomicrobia bacterium]|nr:1-acyl-sn-glycerol-3-phosphate acyltransferase [Verrucomicrobiota bacterium]